VTTPKRWIDEHSDADDFERAILRSELDAAPPPDASGDVLKRVMAVVAPIGPGAPIPTGTVEPATGGLLGGGAIAKGAATLGGLGKGFALGVGVSIAAATGSHFIGAGPFATAPAPSSTAIQAQSVSSARPRATRPDETAPAAPANQPTHEPQTEPEPPSRGAAPIGTAPVSTPRSPAAQTPGASSVASFPSDEAALAASRLKEEAALLRRARAELRAGALAQAFATLEASRRAFTAPELTQEREALAIELLYRSGERAAAASRARDFLARFPESPHAAAVRGFADDARR
jgi:hypothetical protein